MCFLQLNGMPLGFFYYYESTWLLQIKKQGLREARIFSNNSRFKKDLCPVNNDEFENDYKTNHPDELEVKRENEDPPKASFLDLPILVHDTRFITGLFGKSDVLPFYINRMSYLCNNIPSKKFYASIVSEILRIEKEVTDLI